MEEKREPLMQILLLDRLYCLDLMEMVVQQIM